MVIAIEKQVREFEMPGTGIVDFDAHARAIAKAGIYDFQVHHDQILPPVVLRHWGIEDLTGLSDEAERARDALLTRIRRIGKAGRAPRPAPGRGRADAGATSDAERPAASRSDRRRASAGGSSSSSAARSCSSALARSAAPAPA